MSQNTTETESPFARAQALSIAAKRLAGINESVNDLTWADCIDDLEAGWIETADSIADFSHRLRGRRIDVAAGAVLFLHYQARPGARREHLLVIQGIGQTGQNVVVTL